MKVTKLLFLLALPLLAQDTRTVAEPRIPPVFTTLTANQDADERHLDTRRIQEAIDRCTPAHAVALRGGIFLSGPLQLKPAVTLLVEADSAIFASRNPRNYDLTPGSCGVVNERGHGCQPFIQAINAPGSAIMGEGAIDGRGGAELLGKNVTWWDLAHQAKVLDQQQSVPRMLIVRQSDGFTLYRITLRNSPNFHVSVEQTNGFTAWGVKIRTPKTARNTDGIDPSSSTNVTITHCDISTGDDDVAIKSGAQGPATHMTISHNAFHSGHGMSIGSGTSGGVSAIRVSDLTIDGADNGIRIKSDRSRGGLVQDVAYENVCMRNVPNPIILTSMYTTFAGDKIPVYRDILLKNVHALTPGRVTFLGTDPDHKLEINLDDVTVAGLTPERERIENADIKGTIGTRTPPNACRFPAMPQVTTAPESDVKIPSEDPVFYVAASGTGDYWSVQQAVDVAPPGAIISIAPGVYREQLKITKPNLHLRSPYKDATRTVICSVEIRAPGFTAQNLTFGGCTQ